jgi:hypothetical protein
MQHRRFLPCKDKYHQWRTWFDGMIKNEDALKYQEGEFVFEMTKNINIVFRKPVKGKKRKKNKKAPKDYLSVFSAPTSYRVVKITHSSFELVMQRTG